LIDLSKTCSVCGKTYIGYHYCQPPLKSEYDRGFADGKSSFGGYLKPPIEISKTCFKCGQTYTGTHICLESFKSDYQRGYDAGKEKRSRELGYSGKLGFRHVGK
jgi:hypothetical protein